MIDAFLAIRREHTRALLVIAPRHPEVAANLDDIETRLTAGGLVASWRSRIPDAALPDRTDVLVVDTMGELRDLYAVSQAAHVGVDHNVLEPLTYFKPTSVLPGWESTFPSFPVYTMLRNAGALMVAEDAHSLVVCWRDALTGRATSLVQQARDVLMRSGSSLDQHLEALAPVLDSLRPMPSNAP